MEYLLNSVPKIIVAKNLCGTGTFKVNYGRERKAEAAEEDEVASRTNNFWSHFHKKLWVSRIIIA